MTFDGQFMDAFVRAIRDAQENQVRPTRVRHTRHTGVKEFSDRRAGNICGGKRGAVDRVPITPEAIKICHSVLSPPKVLQTYIFPVPPGL